MMNNNLTLEWSLDGGRQRKTEDTPMPTPLGKLPRVARLMALAIKFDGMLREGVATDYADLARLGLVTRARMTQIMNLLNLAPDIQEQILFSPLIKGLNERNLRPVVSSIPYSLTDGP